MLVLVDRTLPAIGSDVIEVHVSEATAFGRISEAGSVRMVIPTSGLWNSLEVLATLALASALIVSLAFCLITFSRI